MACYDVASNIWPALVQKAAGTTMRFIFDKQVAMGEWEFLPMCHYGFGPQQWTDVAARFKGAALDPRRLASGVGPRIIVEIRNEWAATDAFERVVVRDLRRLKAATAHLGQARAPLTPTSSTWHRALHRLLD